MVITTNVMINDIIASLNNSASNIAFVINGKSYTYGVLGEMIKSILVSLPFENKRIGILGEDDIHTYAAILAVLISGNTYVILHPSYPDERNRKIMSSADISFVLGCSRKPNYIENHIYLSTDKLLAIESNKDLAAKGDRSTYAYIIFTSGSTGEPKGVPISRSNLDAFYDSYKQLHWNLNESDKMLQMFELTFDVSVVSFLYPLTLGASIYTVGHKDIKHFKVASLLEDESLTFAAVTPSLLQLLSPYFSDIHLPHLKYLVVAAEASQVEIISKFRQCAPHATFVNLYGPTEATIYCCSYKIPKEDIKEYNGMIAIGHPFTGTEAIIVDEKGDRLAIGEKGELLISGPQVMGGYLNNPEKTNEAMTESPTGDMFYRTGDLCIMDEEGDIFYCGRKDHQVKIQGFRIELSEIENTAKKFLNFSRNAIAITYSQQGTGDSIALIIEGRDGIDTESLKAYLQRELPYYMIPREIQFFEKFPINNSNKIDRTKIKEIFNSFN